MTASVPGLRPFGHQTEVFAEARDKQVFQQMFYLKTLYDLTAELSPITSSRHLIESFLLMIMGVNGSAQAMLMICDRQNRQVLSANRGTTLDREWTVESAERYLYLGFQTADNRRLAPLSVTFLREPHQVFTELETGIDIHTALLFMVDESLLGIIGLGLPIDGREGSQEEKEILSGMTASFLVYLKNVRAYETVQTLNANLSRTNEELRRTITDLTEARQQIRLLEVAGIRLKEMFRQKIEQVGRFRMRDVLMVLAVATILSMLFNLSNPNGISLLPEVMFREPVARVEIRTVRERLDREPIVLVDARPAELFKLGHIPQAVNIPAPLFDIIFPMKLASRLQTGQPVVVYGRTISRRYDEEVAYRLRLRHDDVTVMIGELSDWVKSESGP